MSGLLDAIEAMAPDELAGALVALDHVSRPLTAREIEQALRAHGFTKSRAVIIAASVKRLGIVAVVGGGIKPPAPSRLYRPNSSQIINRNIGSNRHDSD